MSDQVITCPRCGCEIPLTEAISQRMREQLEKELQGRLAEREAELRRTQEELAAGKRELEEGRRKLEEELGRRVEQARADIEKEAAEKARKAQLLEMEDLRSQLEEKDRNLEELRKQELELRKRERELEKAQKEQELELERRLDAEKKRMDEELRSTLGEQFKLKEQEYQDRLESLSKQLEEAKRRAEGGSGRDMGEAWEELLEDILRRLCPEDAIEPVKTGKRGADIVQRVKDERGQDCGVILWEAKRVQNWQNEWIEKLKQDQRTQGADLAVIVSGVLPSGIRGFGNLKGVWVCDRPSLDGLVFALRLQLQEVQRARAASEGREYKMEMLYEYLSGQSFRQRVETIVEAFGSMREDLAKERAAMEKIWKKREKQIEKVIASTTGMYGELQGIIGASMPEIESMELRAIAGAGEEVGSGDDLEA